jgi:hypothetical protein
MTSRRKPVGVSKHLNASKGLLGDVIRTRYLIGSAALAGALAGVGAASAVAVAAP